MKYIEKIILENFQSHEYTELRLSRGVNVIVGPSDSGKTAVMRALKWNLFNEPSGVEFVREGEREVSVSITFQNKVEVVRRRSKSKNQYILRIPGEDELIFEGFGTHVPREIKEATGIYKVLLDDKKMLSLNFSDQLEGPFLLQESDSYKAQAIGRMVGVDVLDEAMRNTLRDKKQISIHKEILEKDCEATEKSLEAFKQLDEKIILRDRLKKMYEKIQNLEEKNRRASGYREKQIDLINAREETQRVLDRYGELENVKDYLLKLQSKINHYRSEKHLRDDYLRNLEAGKETKILLSTLVDERISTQLLSALKPSYERYRRMNPLYERQKELNDRRKIMLEILKNSKQIEEIPLETIATRHQFLNRCLKFLNAQKEIQARINKGHIFLSHYESLDRVRENCEKINRSHHLTMELEGFYRDKQILAKKRVKYGREYSEASEKSRSYLDAYLDALKEAGTCPVCKQAITEGHLETIKETLEDDDEFGRTHQ